MGNFHFGLSNRTSIMFISEKFGEQRGGDRGTILVCSVAKASSAAGRIHLSRGFKSGQSLEGQLSSISLRGRAVCNRNTVLIRANSGVKRHLLGILTVKE